jgi:hypothetical protein
MPTCLFKFVGLGTLNEKLKVCKLCRFNLNFVFRCMSVGSLIANFSNHMPSLNEKAGYETSLLMLDMKQFLTVSSKKLIMASGVLSW